jgi:glutamate-5-semialdehyde dehydrogenase
MLPLAMDSIGRAVRKSKEASYRLQSVPIETRNRALQAIADELVRRKKEIVKENESDMANAKHSNLPSPLLKRLKYDEQKLEESVESLRSLTRLEDPIGRVLAKTELDEGLILEKVSCPIGVIGVIFESRPDALVQISSLCLKSGNAVLLKGGSEAKRTNEVLARAIKEAVVSVDKRFVNAVQILSTRKEFHRLLELGHFVDLIVPRGSNELVRSIKESTRIPVLGHAAGVCHTYVDDNADLKMAIRVCYDAKVQYPAVCNAMETLLVHRDIAAEFLPRIASEFAKANVELRGDELTRRYIEIEAATEEDWHTEYGDLILNVKIVSSIDEAIHHVNIFGSHHTDAIVTRNERKARKFMDLVDSSSIMWNCSTRFADGYRYGLGAEVGISTSKTHARGPVGLEGLVIYKYRLSGKGHVVADYVGKDAKRFTHRKLK